jgi:hypothetical protein
MDASLGVELFASPSQTLGVTHFGAVSVMTQPDVGAAVDVFANGILIPVLATWDSSADGSGVNQTTNPAFRVALHYINIQEEGPVILTASSALEEGWLVYPFRISTGDPLASPFLDIQFRSGYGDRFEGDAEGTSITTEASGEVVFLFGTTPARLYIDGIELRDIPDANVNTMGTKYIMPEYPLETLDPANNKFYVENTIRSDIELPGSVSVLKASILRPAGGGPVRYIRTPGNGNRIHVRATDQEGWQDVLLPFPQTANYSTAFDSHFDASIGLIIEDEPIVQAQACRSWDVYNTPMDYGTTFDPGPQYPNYADVGLRWITFEAAQVYGVTFYSAIDLHPGL